MRTRNRGGIFAILGAYLSQFMFDADGAGSMLGSGSGGSGDVGMGGAGGQQQQQQQQVVVPDWLKNHSNEKLRDSKSLARYKTPEDVHTAYLELEKASGGKIAVPGPEADDATRNAFFKTLGRPDKMEDYKLPQVKIPDGLPWDKDFQGRMLKVMHETGLTQTQVEKVFSAYTGDTVKGYEGLMTKQQQEVEAGITTLKTEWKGEFDANVGLAKRAVMQFGGKPIIDWMDSTGLGNNANMIKMFANIGKALGEDLASGGGEGTGGNMNVETAKTKIAEFQKDKVLMDALWNKQNPEHKATLKKWEDLHKMAHPGVEKQE